MNIRVFLNNEIVILLLIFWYIEPAYFQQISAVNNIYNFGRVCFLCFGLLLYFLFKKNKNYSYDLIVILFLWIIFTTFLHNGNLSELSYELLCAGGLCTYIALYTEFNSIKILVVIYKLLYIFIVINLICMFIFPHGMYTSMGGDGVTVYWQNWFLGYKNYPIRIFIPALVLGHLLCRFGKKKNTLIILYVICFVSSILLDSSTGLIGIFVFSALAFCILHLNTIKKIINLKTAVIFTIIIFYVVIIAQSQNSILAYITNFFGKDLTFSGRISIWHDSITAILQSFLTGHGQFSGSDFQNITGSFAFHPHNYFLYVLFRGGVIELLIIALFIGSIFFSIKRQPNLYRLACVYTISMFLMGITESLITTAVLFYPVFLFFNLIESYESHVA